MGSKMKILYIDDEELNLTSFFRLFRRSYDIKTASSAEQGLEILKEDVFHVILVDQRMPGTTGSEFFKEIVDIYPDSMRILVTAYSDLSAVISAVNEGKIYKYVSKPYRKEDMVEVLEDAYQVYRFRTSQNNNSSKYKEAFLNSIDSLFLVSKDSKIIDVNRSCLSLLRTSRDELITQHVSNLLKKISLKEDVLSALEESDSIDDFEVNFSSIDKIEHNCLVSFKKISLEDDDTVGFQGTIKDISDYKSTLRSSMRSLIEYKENDRENFVNVLHESSAQNLSGIHFLLNQLDKSNESEDKETLDEVKSTLVQTIDELRDLCFSILPKSLDFGLTSAIEDLTARIEVAYQANCTVEVEDDLVETSRDFRLMIFRTIQNTLRGLKKENSELSIEISRDDYCLYSEVTGRKLQGNDRIISQVETEVDCYSGSMTQQPAMNNQICYRMVFPVHTV